MARHLSGGGCERRLRAPVRSSRSMPAAIKRQASACGPSTSSAAPPNLTANRQAGAAQAAVSAGGRRRPDEGGRRCLQQPPRPAARAWADREVTKVVISVTCCDLPCTGVFAVISLLGSSFATERSGERCHRSALGAAGPVLMKRSFNPTMGITEAATRICANSSSNPGGPANFTHGCRLPASLWDRGSPTAFCVRPAATLAQIQGAFDLLRISRSVATETVSDTVSPMFGVCLISGYRLRSGRRFKSKFAEVESVSPEVASSPPEFEADLESPRQLIGSCSVSLGHVIHCGGRVTCQLGETLQLALRGRGLDKKDLFGKSDPYVLLQPPELMRSYRRTEVVKKPWTPDWRPNQGGQYGPPVRRRHAKASSSANSRPQLTICWRAELGAAVRSWDLCFTVAIDMTASNGVASQPTSLHYTDPTPRAMQAVLEIIQDYD
uniref:Copine domain-containing protein n=1 Tax=Macrostomum lignano TaxID=282301 RepID=A0A1I8FMK7_9PLAT